MTGDNCVKLDVCPPDDYNSFLGTRSQLACTELIVDVCAQGGANDAFWQPDAPECTPDNFKDFVIAKCARRYGSTSQDKLDGYSTSLLRWDMVADTYGFNYSQTSR